MPLSKKRDKDRKGLSKFQPNSNPNYTKLSNLKQEKIKGLRDIMKDISLTNDPIGDESHESKWVKAGYETMGWDAEPNDREDWPDIDADGNLIPDF